MGWHVFLRSREAPGRAETAAGGGCGLVAGDPRPLLEGVLGLRGKRKSASASKGRPLIVFTPRLTRIWYQEDCIRHVRCQVEKMEGCVKTLSKGLQALGLGELEEGEGSLQKHRRNSRILKHHRDLDEVRTRPRVHEGYIASSLTHAPLLDSSLRFLSFWMRASAVESTRMPLT